VEALVGLFGGGSGVEGVEVKMADWDFGAVLGGTANDGMGWDIARGAVRRSCYCCWSRGGGGAWKCGVGSSGHGVGSWSTV
jgi:hypothetical protein